jgi:hypothetical protein
MREALKVLNDLEREGVLGRHAIGRAMGATFYTEPFTTFDLDVFVALPVTLSGLVTLTPLYDALRKRGFTPEGECVMIAGTPVQFLPVSGPLVEEALLKARETDYDGVPTRVFRAEHLAAIAVQTARAKDRQRVQILLDEADMDPELLADILQRHGLTDRWNTWTKT